MERSRQALFARGYGFPVVERTCHQSAAVAKGRARLRSLSDALGTGNFIYELVEIYNDK